MAEQTDIKDMPTEELNAALKSELDKLDGKAQATPAEPEIKPEPETVEAAPEKEATEETGEGEEGPKDGEEGNPYRKRIDRLLRRRDNLQETVAEKEARIAALEAENAQLKAAEEKSDEPVDISQTIHKVLDERESRNKNVQAKLQGQEQEFSKLVKQVPGATKRKAEILELADKYPSLTFEALDRMLAPADHIDPVENNRKNAKRMDVSARSRADLESEQDMTKASAAEQEKYLREQIAAGKLVV